jgi:FtsP/CotA-like multicopper oxidase with cupredoxin domain
MRVVAFIVSAFWIVTPLWALQQVVADSPEVRSPFTLVATYDSVVAHNAFADNGNTVPPVIRVMPGGVIKLPYVNNMPIQSDEMCASRCTNMTNLHFHGRHVSPQNPQDDVLTMVAMPGQALDYKVEVPSYAAPGLYWYHTHPHGKSARQDLDGMSGAIIVEGIDRYYPQVRNMRERVLILRDQDLSEAGLRERTLRRVEVSASSCGTATAETRSNLHAERCGSTSDPDGCRGASVLAHCQCLSGPLCRSSTEWWAVRNCGPGRHAAFVSRPTAIYTKSRSRCATSCRPDGSDCHWAALRFRSYPSTRI